MRRLYKQSDCVWQGCILVKQSPIQAFRPFIQGLGFIHAVASSPPGETLQAGNGRVHTHQNRFGLRFPVLLWRNCRQHLRGDLDNALRSTPAVRKHRYPAQEPHGLLRVSEKQRSLQLLRHDYRPATPKPIKFDSNSGDACHKIPISLDSLWN
jgi:hypothetical protein